MSAVVTSVTVIGNLALDRVDGSQPRPGGCPAFVAEALCALGGHASVLTQCNPGDREVFAHSFDGVDAVVLDAEETAAFDIHLAGDDRSLVVRALGGQWRPESVLTAPLAAWVHVAPLLREEMPVATLAVLARAGSRVSFDGQGLVRARALGPLRLDAAFDAESLRHLQVLKLAEDEAEAIAGRPFGAADARRLGVPEIVVTLGSRGVRVFHEGRVWAIPPSRVVRSADTTGAGDTFMLAYVSGRAAGAEPVDAARHADEIVAAVLEARGSPR